MSESSLARVFNSFAGIDIASALIDLNWCLMCAPRPCAFDTCLAETSLYWTMTSTLAEPLSESFRSLENFLPFAQAELCPRNRNAASATAAVARRPQFALRRDCCFIQ